jgi:deoxyribonuclease (pyrimidine dimer)
MTRINLVPPEDLADQHLFAEWRESKMVPAALLRSMKTKSVNDILRSIPEKYTLNTGHVTFFYDKMYFLHQRFLALTEELENRNYNLTECDPEAIFLDPFPADFVQDYWDAMPDEIAVNVERIVLRLNEKPDWYRYYGDVMTPGYFEQLYKLYIDTVRQRLNPVDTTSIDATV